MATRNIPWLFCALTFGGIPLACHTSSTPEDEIDRNDRESRDRSDSASDSTSTADSETGTGSDAVTTPDGGNHCLEVDTSSETEEGATDDTATASGVSSETDSEPGPTDVPTDTETAERTDTAPILDTDTAPDTDPPADTETPPDTATPDDTETTPHTDTLVETDTPPGTDPTQDTDTNPPVDTGTGAETETEPDNDTGTALVEACPDDMVIVTMADTEGTHAFCMDRYEAARQDADDTTGGVDNSVAVSKKGVIPWFVNPMTADALTSFEGACAAAGKRLCEPEEWTASCAGPAQTRYVFGDTFDREICNCVDTFCDDYCLEMGIPTDECNLAGNCGYSCGATEAPTQCFRVMLTGSFAGCTNELGTFDINGNVWEVVPSTTDPRGYEVRGGAFNCASASARLQCTYNATWTALYAGFRCCKDINEK